jgi:alkylated DNA repair protein (DNA oxidative demethylase)
MLEGFRFLPEYFPPEAQKRLVAEVLGLLETNPLYTATMPRSGKPMSVRMSNLGPLGWVSDITGYRYEPAHPVTMKPWPPIPQALLDLWGDVSDWPAPPEACLVNWYEADSRLGLHDAQHGQHRPSPDRAVLGRVLGGFRRHRVHGARVREPTEPRPDAPAGFTRS